MFGRRRRSGIIFCPSCGEFIGRRRTRIDEFRAPLPQRLEPGRLMTGIDDQLNFPVSKQRHDTSAGFIHRCIASAARLVVASR
jgi:hypothetical protein